MNKAIKELATRAAESTTWKPGLGNADVAAYIQKFAELIVQECIAVHVDDYGIDIIGDVLKRHFGVEQ